MTLHLFLVASAIFVLGVVVLCLVTFRWGFIGRVYSSTWSKPVLSLAKVFPTALAVYARRAATPEAVLADLAVYVGLANLILWESVDALAGHKKGADRKRDDDSRREREDEADLWRNQAQVRTQLISYLGQLVSHKKQRLLPIVKRLARGDFSRARPEAYRRALAPGDQTLQILQLLVLLLRDLPPRAEPGEAQNFRVGLYVETKGVMTPVESWDHMKKERQFFTSYRLAPQKFEVDCRDNPACAVRCIQSGTLVIVPDCERDLPAIHDRQRKYLRSLVAFPILGYAGDGAVARRPRSSSIPTRLTTSAKRIGTRSKSSCRNSASGSTWKP